MTGEMIDMQPLRQRGTLCTSKKGFKERKKATISSSKTTQKRSCFEQQLPRQPFTHLLSQQNFETIPRRSGSFLSESLRQIFFGENKRKMRKKEIPEVDCCSLCSYRPVMLFFQQLLREAAREASDWWPADSVGLLQ